MREKHNSSYLSKINESNAKTTSNIVLLELFPHLDYDDKLLSCADERVRIRLMQFAGVQEVTNGK